MLQVGEYRKTEHSGTDCVLVALLPDGMVAIKDSKDEQKPPHIYTRDEWIAFIRGAKDGEFDYPSLDEELAAV